ncbi:MAG: hypothetical protein Q7T20_02930 [Saprospiraceae bacterium]|nr:hypothetical protein [Saprospiraceae bacterium]
MTRIFILLLLALSFTTKLTGQFVQGDDPLGRPYRPIVGVLNADVAPGIPAKVAEQISISFTNGLKNLGGAFPPYEVVNKDQLSKAVDMMKRGLSAQELRTTKFWDDMVGAQYLLRLDINSFEIGVDEDSIYDEKKKFVRVDRFRVASANLTARLVDVATSKVLMFNNFDASGTTRGFEEYKTQTDSARAVMQLNKQIRAYGNGMIHNVVAGAATITSIYKENKGKAEEVILNNAPIIVPNREDGLHVYAVLKTYTSNGQIFRDVEKVGEINKGKNFQISLRNFEVRKGEKKIAEHIIAGTTLICTSGGFPIGPFAPSEARSSLALQAFKNTAAAPAKVQRILQDILSENAARNPLLLDIVDREIYDLIQKEREMQQQTRSDATQAGISFGSNFFLNIDLLDFRKASTLKYKTITETKPVAPVAKTAPAPVTKSDKIVEPGSGKNTKLQNPPAKDKINPSTNSAPAAAPAPAPVEKITKTIPDKYEAKATAKLNVSLVSVQTGEVVFANAYSLSGEGTIAYNKDKFDRVRSEEMAFRNLATTVSGLIWKDIQKNLTPKFQVLAVIETSKNGAETVLVSGGLRSGFSDGMTVELVEIVQEQVEGQKFDRDVVIGEMKITEIRPETSVCKVKNGSKELLMKLDGKARVYCRKG